MKLFLPILQALTEANICYVTVGGIAAVIHGVPRLTGDINLVLDLEEENCKKTLEVLTSLKFTPRAPVQMMDFADSDIRRKWIGEKGMVVFSLHSPQFPMVMVDIFTDPPLPYVELIERAERVEIEECLITIASIDDIIAMKELAGREKDLEDIRVLRKLNSS